MKMRQLTARVLASVVAAVAVLVAVPSVASAAPAPRLGILGEDIWVVGPNAYCNGAIHVGVDTKQSRPGHATIVLSPRGMSGYEPDWSRNPVCNVTVALNWYTGPFLQEKAVPLSIGKRPQAPTRIEIKANSGINLMSFTTHPDPNKGVSYYVLIP